MMDDTLGMNGWENVILLLYTEESSSFQGEVMKCYTLGTAKLNE